MEKVSYQIKEDKFIPVVIKKGDRETPVWIQQNWEEGEYAIYIRQSGCGHSCTAMALRLLGFNEMTPYLEYEHCRKLWGAPMTKEESPKGEAQCNFLTPSGIVKVLNSFSVKAKDYSVPKGKRKECVNHMVEALKEGKLVIFASHPSEDFPENPFSKGDHYVLLVGFNKDNKIVVANSSNGGVTETLGIHDGVEEEVLERALWDGGESLDGTWGYLSCLEKETGYIIVG